MPSTPPEYVANTGYAGTGRAEIDARHAAHETAHRTGDAETATYINGGEAIPRATLERLC